MCVKLEYCKCHYKKESPKRYYHRKKTLFQLLCFPSNLALSSDSYSDCQSMRGFDIFLLFVVFGGISGIFAAEPDGEPGALVVTLSEEELRNPCVKYTTKNQCRRNDCSWCSGTCCLKPEHCCGQECDGKTCKGLCCLEGTVCCGKFDPLQPTRQPTCCDLKSQRCDADGHCLPLSAGGEL
jgi:hypothetical protein